MQLLDVAECPIDPSVLLFCFSGHQNSNLWQIHQNQHMNHKPQSLSVLPWLAVVAGFLTLVATCELRIPAAFADEAQPPVEAAAPATAEAQEPAAADSQNSVAQSGDELLTQVRAKLEGLDSLKCELHQTAVISGMKLTAFGRYTEASGNRVHLQYHIFPLIQAKADDVKALALDAEAPTLNEADNRGILIQVSDGEVLYTSWKNGDAVKVTRRSIRDILAAALAVSNYDPQDAAMDLGIGGLRGLISRLQTSMEFAAAKPVKVGERDFLEVTGRWNQRVRNEVFKLPEGLVTMPQPFLPEYVRVFVDAQTLLPRRIQYLKRSLDPTQNIVRPLITLDLRNLVLNETVDDQLFVFQSSEGTPEDDLTQQVIQAIQEAGKPPEEGTPAGVIPQGTPENTATPAPAKEN